MLSLFRKKTSKKSSPVETAKSAIVTERNSEQISNRQAYEEISLRAYQHWLARGGTHGYDHEDWFKAEKELALSN